MNACHGGQFFLGGGIFRARLRRTIRFLDTDSRSAEQFSSLGLAVGAVIAQCEQIMQLTHIESLSLLRILKDLIREELLEDLPMIDLLLDGSGRHETVDLNLALLA